MTELLPNAESVATALADCARFERIYEEPLLRNEVIEEIEAAGNESSHD